MRLLAPIDRHDRTLLLGCATLACLFILVLALFSPPRDNDDPTPSSYSTAPHGAKAAYDLLRQSGYQVERQSEPLEQWLSQAGNRIDEHTTVVFAQPFLQNVDGARGTVQAILQKGGRVLVTGFAGGLLLPQNAVVARRSQNECNAQANGFGELAASGDIRITPEAYWKTSDALYEAEYTCADQVVAATYKLRTGVAIWWASSSPLENSGIQKADNLVLFLNSIGPPTTTHVVWDESLHGDAPFLLSYTKDTPLRWIGWQLALVAALLLWSRGRRSGPLRPDPILPRATPIEFVHSLGSLYQASAATQTAVNDAYHYFRRRLERWIGISQTLAAESSAMSTALAQLFGARAETLQKTLVICEEARASEKLSTTHALNAIQALHEFNDVIANSSTGNQTWNKTHR
jgi:Domain of unknown function (DUF4350)